MYSVYKHTAPNGKVYIGITGEIFTTVTEAARSVGISRQAICRQIKGLSKSAGGYKWRYAI